MSETKVRSYRQDVARILSSKAYARYVDKTQVVYLMHDDHLTRRGLHVQLVSHFARGIATLLKLDTDLVEAIALGHDVGHPPFGHEGEGYLSALSEEYGCGPFAHSVQSCRLLALIEPLELNLEVLDGFLCHDGGLQETRLKAVKEKSLEQHERELKQKAQQPDLNVTPMTFEGCLVKLCDTVSYVARDLEDAIKMGLVERNQVPKTRLGNTQEEILSQFEQDLVQCSSEQEIAISKETAQDLKTLRRFNYDTFYFHPRLKVESAKIKRSYRLLFEYLLEDYCEKQQESYLWREFLANKQKAYVEAHSSAQLTVDFIAGMTDGFFVRTLEKLLVPGQITC